MPVSRIVKTSFATIPIIVLTEIGIVGAQPVLTHDNTLRRFVGFSVEFGTAEVTSSEDAQHLVEISGTERTWDVSELPFDGATMESIYYTEPHDQMPNISDPRLMDANVAAVSDPETGTWTYQRLDESGQYLLGRVTLRDVNSDGRRDTLLNVYDPASLIFPFPLTMGTTWQDSTTQTLEFQGSPPVPVETVVASHTVDGWGTLVSPDGMSPAIRIRTDAQVTAAGGQRSRRHAIRILTPVPEGLIEHATYAARAEMLVDSLDALLSFSYVSFSPSRPVGTNDEVPVVASVELKPNYPNPFRISTTVPFELDDPGRVRVAVFDVVGRRVAEIMDQTLHPGTHNVTWHADGAPSGIYRILLETGKDASSRLVVLQK